MAQPEGPGTPKPETPAAGIACVVVLIVGLLAVLGTVILVGGGRV